LAQSKDLGFERRLYYSAKFLGQLSQNLWLAALFLAAGTGGRPALDLSSLFLATIIPSVIFGLPGGSIADRLGPARGLALGATWRFSAVALGLVLLDGGTSAWILAFLYSTGSQIFTPAEMALVRPLQDHGSGRVHSWLVALQYAGQGGGMLILAPILYWTGGQNAMVAGASFGFLALTAAALTLARRLAAHAEASTTAPDRAISFRETMRFFGREPLARFAVATLGLKMVVSKGIVVTLPFYLETNIGLGFSALAYLAVPAVAGILLGLVWCARTLTLERARPVMSMAIMGMAVSLVALAVLDYGITAAARYSQIPPVVQLEASMNTPFVAAVPVAFLLGLCLSGALIASRVALTETAPLGQQGRVFAVQLTVTELLIAVPLMSMGVGTEFAGARMTLAVLASLVVVVLAIVEVDRLKSARKALPEVVAAPAPSTA
jgi:MFS family permease